MKNEIMLKEITLETQATLKLGFFVLANALLKREIHIKLKNTLLKLK